MVLPRGSSFAAKYKLEKNKECYILKLQAALLLDLHLTLLPKPVSYLPGHFVIPEINSNDKRMERTLRYNIAQRLTIDNVVHWPYGL